MSEKRITPEEVVEAYKATGVKPARKVFYDGNCACGLSVTAIATGLSLDILNDCAPDVEPVVLGHHVRQGRENRYLFGFIEGFDGAIGPGDDCSGNFLQGYADGKAAAAAVFKEGATQ